MLFERDDAMSCLFTSFAYAPSRFNSCSCVPFSMGSPSFTTMIISASRIVDRRCAMTITVISPLAIIESIAACTTASDPASSADVASSRSSTFGFRTKALAIAIRCFCPPDSWVPRSPTWVS
mmetsp:Transcript_30634/g.49118  ORF Transcript_30634/g.49118 Transcript_30634/m.49118 type:complete len:122 (+) Transcript_30634:286-651(+)